MKRAPVAVGAVMACGLALTACGTAERDDAAAAVTNYAAALARQDAGGAAGYTTAPGQAGDSLAQTLRDMEAQDVDVDVSDTVEYSDGTASFSLKTTWRWADERTFEAVSSGTARHLSTGWKVTWEPSLLYPGLHNGEQLRQIRTDATPPPRVRSTSGRTFMYLQPVNEIVLDPSATSDLAGTVDRLVAAIKPIAPLITASVINEKLAERPGKAITAVTLRNSDMEVLAFDPGRVAGVTVRRTDKLVMADRRLNSPLEEGLTNYWQAIRDATAGWQVQRVTPGVAPRKLAGEQGPAGPDVPTTVDQNVQLTLGDVAVEVAQPATILTLDAQTGAVLGMAQNDAAKEREINVDATYPAGTALDPVLDAVDRAVSGNTVGGASGEELLDRLGLGVQFTVPGASAPALGTPGVTTIGFRPQAMNVSMMNMGALGVALARSAGGTSTSVAPYVINGVPTKVVGGALGDLDPAITVPVLKDMDTVARTGDASDLVKAPGLRALVGTNGPQGPGWFVGLQGGKVIVIYTEGEKSGTAALQVAQKYFTIK